MRNNFQVLRLFKELITINFSFLQYLKHIAFALAKVAKI